MNIVQRVTYILCISMFRFRTLRKSKVIALGLSSLFLAFPENNGFSQIIFDGGGSKIGEIELNGTVRNASGEKIGVVWYTGTVFNGSHVVIGEFENNGIVRSAGGTRIGEINREGIVMNEFGIKIGEIDSKGIVKDATGTKIGEAPRINKKCVSAFFFFFNPDRPLK
jgi:hypothetical protein